MKFFTPIRRFLFTLFIINVCSSCSKITPEPMKNKPADAWEIWEQQQPDGIMFYSGSQSIYEFKADSFRLKIESWTDAITIIRFVDSLGVEHMITDPCFGMSGVRTDYIFGVSAIHNDSITFTGKMCDSLFFTTQSGCDGSIDYIRSYKFIYNNDTTLTLNPDGAVNYQDIVLKRK